MNVDAELRAWQRDWREQSLPTTSADELARLVHRGTRNALYGTLGAAAFTLLAVVPLMQRALRGEIEPRFLIGILTFVALVWGSALWLSRGTWQPRDESTNAFLDISIRRCRAGLLSVPIAIVLYLSELLYVVMSAHRADTLAWSELLMSRGFIIAGWIGGPLYIGGQLWYARVQRRRLTRLRELQVELAGSV
ncbi:MAG: hypothetical protein ABW136_03985 [Steroidobacteraceae bacterium]